VIALIVGTLSLVPDLGYLSKASASGLVVLGFTFATIAVYAKPSNVHGPHLNLWPHDGMTGASNWFGCVVFGFGVAPLTYNYYESMAQPQYLTNATAVALLGVALCYMLIGCSLLLLYFPVQGDILQQLPVDELVPLLVRLAMIVVVVLTSPLIVLPCGLILEEKLMLNPTKQMQATIRYSICILCAIISVRIPAFVYVLSFVGCFCVALVGFVIPPLLHIALVLKYNRGKPLMGLLLDFVMLAWGISAAVISSAYTFQNLRSN
jgi:Transmembrane amino acid transporter protein